MENKDLVEIIKTPDIFVGLIRDIIKETEYQIKQNKVIKGEYLWYYRNILREAERLLAVDDLYNDYGIKSDRFKDD